MGTINPYIQKIKNIKLHKVDGHSGNHWNEVVDKMAVEARKKFMLNIIMPTFNSTATLPRALGSLVSQTKQQFMLTIVDDCSYIGDVKQILSEFTHVLKCPISYLQTEVNSGPGAARQLGIDRTDEKVDYVMFFGL